MGLWTGTFEDESRFGRGGSLTISNDIVDVLPPFDQEVADEAARLSLTGISVGWKVKDTDTGLIWQYNGASTDDVAGITINGGLYFYSVNGTVNGRNNYSDVNVPPVGTDIFWDPTINHGDGGWSVVGGTEASGDTTFPWDADWGGAITVTRNDIAAPSNWTVVP